MKRKDQVEVIDSKQNGWPTVRSQVPQARIALNYKCGKACFYCRPFGESVQAEHTEAGRGVSDTLLTVEEVCRIAATLSRNGVTDFKLTGGDPILRDDIIDIVSGLKAIPSVRSLHLITRHHRAGELALALKAAGLDLLNFSLDSLDEKKWESITRTNGHSGLMRAIHKCAEVGIPLKINTVVMRGVNDDEIDRLIDFAAEVNAELKLLDLIGDIGGFPGYGPNSLQEYYSDLLPLIDSLSKVSASMKFITQAGGLGHPMPHFVMANGARLTIKSAKLGAYYGSICERCPFFPCWDALMAMRINPSGMLQYCLLNSKDMLDLRQVLSMTERAEQDRVINEALKVYTTAKQYTGDEIANLRESKRA